MNIFYYSIITTKICDILLSINSYLSNINKILVRKTFNTLKNLINKIYKDNI